MEWERMSWSMSTATLLTHTGIFFAELCVWSDSASICAVARRYTCIYVCMYLCRSNEKFCVCMCVVFCVSTWVMVVCVCVCVCMCVCV